MSSTVQEQATIIDFLSHRTGITNFDAPWLQSGNTILMQRDQILPFFATLKPIQEFRTSFCYNNWGYKIVALILEQVSGRSLAELLRVNLFEPLAMYRTSTSWQTDDDNVARSYSVLDDLFPYEINRPQVSDGSLMEAAGGVKSTLHDLIIWYKAWLAAIDPSGGRDAHGSRSSVPKECGMIISSHAQFPGTSLLEQSYALGWARAQLPGQLGRISQNVILGHEPMVGKEANSHLVIYRHGSMPGSTSVVNLIPETGSAVFVLQNSLAPIDAADLVGQMLVEAIIGAPKPNDYIQLAKELTGRGLNHISNISAELTRRRKLGTRPRALQSYVGTYWNSANNFRIDIEVAGENLRLQFQRHPDEIYVLRHYQDDVFEWLMPYNEVVRRGRYVNDFGADFYLIRFEFMHFMHFMEHFERSAIGLYWAWDPALSEDPEYFHVRER